MISLVVSGVCLISCVLGGPVLYGGPVPVHVPVGAPAAVIPLPLLHTIRSQFHSQDELGQYSYGYSNEHSSKVETKDFNGLTSGGYSYIDANGLVQAVNYISDDENGFRVAASNLPVAHVPGHPLPVGVPHIPQPVSDTPEVQKAKEEHEKAKAEAEKAAAEASSEESTEGEESAESTESHEDGSHEETETKPVQPEVHSVTTPLPKTAYNFDTRFSSNVPLDAIRPPYVPAKPIFRAAPAPSYLPYYPGAYVTLNKRETDFRFPGIFNQISASRRLGRPEGYLSERRDVDGNVLRER